MKKLIALLLVAVMCLSLVACGGESGNTETPSGDENTENTGNSQGGDNNGNNLEKIERGTVTTSENPLLPFLLQYLTDKKEWNYQFKEDGTCSDSDFWWIDKESEYSIHIYIAEEYKWKYSIEIRYDTYNDYIHVICDTAIYNGDMLEGWTYYPPESDLYYPQLRPDYQEVFDILNTEWKTTNGDTLVFRKNGTCTINGLEQTWYQFSVDEDFISANEKGNSYYGRVAYFIIGKDRLSVSVSVDIHENGYYYLHIDEYGFFYKADHLEAIEISMNNVEYYMDLTECFK